MDRTSEHCREKIGQSTSRLSSTTSLKSDIDLQQMLHKKKIRSRYMYMEFEPLPPADRMETEMWKRAISVHWDDLGDHLRKEYVDFVIFYSHANVTEAEAFKNHLQNIYSEKDLRIRLLNRKWYQTQKEFDSFSFKTHENSPVTECLSCLVFLSREFCENDWPELSTRDFFTQALYGKKQLIFPVMPQNPETADFRVPMGLNQLTKIQYYKKDDHLYRDNILQLMREQVQKTEKSESDLFTAQCEFVYEKFIKENTSNRESTGSEYSWLKDISDNGDLNSGPHGNIESSEDELSMLLDSLLPGNPLPSLTRLPANQPLDLSVPVRQGYAQMDRRDQYSSNDSIPSEQPVEQAQRPKPTKIDSKFFKFPANYEPLSAVNSISDDSNASTQPVSDCGESQNTILTESEMSSYCEKHGPVKVDQIRLPSTGTPEIDGTLNSLWHETPSPVRASPGYNQLGQNITTPLCERGATNALSQSGLQTEDQKGGNEIERALNKRANVNINLYITTATNVQIGDKARVDNSVTSGTNDPGHQGSASLTNIENGNYVSRGSKLDSNPTVDCGMSGQGGASHTETRENKGMQPNNVTENSTASQALAEETKKSNLNVGTLKPMMSFGSQQPRDDFPEDQEDDSITYVKQMIQSSGQGIDDSERSTGTTAVKSPTCDASKATRVENKTANDKSIKATQVVENSANDKNKASHVKDKNNYDKSKAMHDVDKTTFNKSKATHDVVKTTYDKSKTTVAIDKEYNHEMLKKTERAKQKDVIIWSRSDMPNPPYNKKPWNQTEKRKPLQQTNRNRAVGLVKPICHQKPMTSSSTESEVQCNIISANDDDDDDDDDVNNYNNILSTQPRNEETEVKDAAGDTEETVVKDAAGDTEETVVKEVQW